MDAETKKVLGNQKRLLNLVGHEDWPVARQVLADKILDLQNAFNIEDTDPQKMLVDLQARKLASSILFDFLREIEGTAQQAKETELPKGKSYIVKD